MVLDVAAKAGAGFAGVVLVAPRQIQFSLRWMQQREFVLSATGARLGVELVVSTEMSWWSSLKGVEMML